jgi:hypothetical protein
MVFDSSLFRLLAVNFTIFFGIENFSCAQEEFDSKFVFIDDSVCILKIDYKSGEKTYVSGVYKIKDHNFWFSEISKGFSYLVSMEYTKGEGKKSDSLEIELLITDPLEYGWVALDSLKFRINGINYQSNLIQYKNHDFIQSHYIKIRRPEERIIHLDASSQDSNVMMYEKMYFLKDILLENGYPNKLFCKIFTFSSTDPEDIPLKMLLPKTVEIENKVYNVQNK